MKYFVLFISILMLSCGSGESGFVAKPTTLKNHYFDYADCFEPKILKFIKNMDFEEVTYWQMQTEVLNGDTLFTTTIYDNDLDLVEVYVEQIMPTGAELASYTKYIDGAPLQATILEKQLFKWDQEERRKIVWSFELDYGDYTEQVTKTRKFLGFEGDDYSTAKFKDDFVIKYSTAALVSEQRYNQTSLYSQKIALYQYDRFVPGQGTEEHGAIGKIGADDWAERLKSKGK